MLYFTYSTQPRTHAENVWQMCGKSAKLLRGGLRPRRRAAMHAAGRPSGSVVSRSWLDLQQIEALPFWMVCSAMFSQRSYQNNMYFKNCYQHLVGHRGVKIVEFNATLLKIAGITQNS